MMRPDASYKTTKLMTWVNNGGFRKIHPTSFRDKYSWKKSL